MRVAVVSVGFLGLVSLCLGSPVVQVETTVQPGALENEISFDEATTTEVVSTNEIARSDDASDIKNFKYPLEPEQDLTAENERPLEDAIPKDFDMSQTNLSVVAMKDPDSEIFSGRANCQCGNPGERNLPLRIINGTVVRINDLPWTVALVRKVWYGEPTGAYCGGTLINSKYILTASHCVDGMSARNIEVRVHEEDFSSQTEVDGGTQKLAVEKIIMHPYYDRKTINNDIALLKLTEHVQLDNVVVPACLPANNDYSFEGIEGTVAGWGATTEGSGVSSTINKVEVPIISNEDCNSKTKYVGKISENMLCAGDIEQGGKDSCQGDSGGPLTIANGGRRTLVGIVSWGYGCARPLSPGVYTRTGRYSQWIVANSKGAKWCNA
ncbi:trypsin-1 isoform X2 [Folsomia candida]|uniref:trypsin-1 isoform X2 n=1 Tax=Folsomia candida TaxID=158441 RepID=UPI000B8F184B|nr:trypsin-1 isoform X2 [Folsomia candida]